MGFSVTRRGDNTRNESSASAENVVPRTHDFEGPLCNTAAFPRFSRNFEMNSSELVTIVAEANDLSKAQAQAILDSVLKSIVKAWPAAGFVDTEKRCLMKLEVVHGKASVSARVQG
jgi:Bacterial DNA-binding protein